MALLLKRGIRQRQIDLTWPEAEAPWNSALGMRIRRGRLRAGHRCRCGVIPEGGRTCPACGKALCVNCVVRPKPAGGGPRPRIHVRCMVERYGFAAFRRMVRRGTRVVEAA